MTFFNKQEEVLDIELTQHGKYLLSLGKFKPAYYEFFDDDIIYDVGYSGEQQELQRDIQDRIKQSARPHTQYTFVSSEEDIKKQKQQVRSNNQGSFTDTYVPFNVKQRVLNLPLASSELGQQKTAAWYIRSRKGQISNTITFITGSYCNIKIPRLTLKDVEYKIAVATDVEDIAYVPADTNDTITETSFKPTSNLNDLSSRFKDNTFLQIQEDYILLDLQEINSLMTQENFEIELYEVENTLVRGENVEVLKQLYFNKKQEAVVDNLLLDTDAEISDYKPNAAEMAETYFIIQTDKEIDPNVLCQNLTIEEKQTLVATNQLDLQCSELYGTLTDPRITSDVKPEDILEKC